VSVVIRQSITHPLRTLARRIKAIGQGHFEQRLQMRRRDEIGEVADEFDRMCTRLEEAHRALLAENEEKLRLERALRHSEKLAAVGQIASRLAHEIGTPLNVIQMRAEQLLQREGQSEKDRTFLHVIVAQIERISGFIRQLLTLSRRPEPEFRVIQVNEIAQGVREIMGDREHAPHVTLSFDLAQDVPPVRGDADQLQQVFLNLTLNAFQAVGMAGQITLSTQFVQHGTVPTAGTVEIRVTDTGHGIPPDELPLIFDPFFTTKGAVGGTGLGLAISHEIVASHQGEIRVESVPGKGTRFIVALPPAEDWPGNGGKPVFAQKEDHHADNGTPRS
jgi:two-component system, NtrC family, sensor kinase